MKRCDEEEGSESINPVHAEMFSVSAGFFVGILEGDWKMKKRMFLLLVGVIALANIASAEIVQTIDMEFVTVGNAGNLGEQSRLETVGDTTFYGGVSYEYRIGKYEVTNAQWNTFVADVGIPTGVNGDYSDPTQYNDPQQPANAMNWYGTLQFCNYLTTGDKSMGVYQWSGDNTNPGNFLGIDRASAETIYGDIYFLPTHDEWYKAAYHKNDGVTDNYWLYTTQSDTITTDMANYGQIFSEPTDIGSYSYPSPYGTYDQGGNVWEWTETSFFGNSILRGGMFYNDNPSGLASWARYSDDPFFISDQIGFRIASNVVPEPVVIPVSIDIKPQSCPNPLNTKNQGVLPIAILGSEEFDVSTIDPTSVRLNGIEPIRRSLEDVSAPLDDPNECECTTTGPDGFTDLTLKFKTQDIVEALGEVNTDDILTLPLTGILNDETPIEGSDCVVIVGRHKPVNEADINEDGLVNTVDIALVAENWLESSIVEE